MATSPLSITPRADDASVRRDLEMSMAVANLKRNVQERDQPDHNGDGIPDSQQRSPSGSAAALRTTAAAGDLGNDGVQRVAGVEGRPNDGYSKPRERTRRYRGNNAPTSRKA